MVDIKSWIHEFVVKSKNLFLDRLLFVGLEGDYGSGVATDNSSIDVVVIVDNLDFEDLKNYSEMLNTLTNRKSISGFIAGRDEINNWDKTDLFQLFYETTSYYNELSDVISAPTIFDAKNSLKITACNLLHIATQNYLTQQNAGTLVALYQNALYLLKVKRFIDEGKYYRTNEELKNGLNRDDMVVFTIAEKLKSATEMTLVEFADYEIIMYEWASDIVRNYN